MEIVDSCSMLLPNQVLYRGGLQAGAANVQRRRHQYWLEISGRESRWFWLWSLPRPIWDIWEDVEEINAFNVDECWRRLVGDCGVTALVAYAVVPCRACFILFGFFGTSFCLKPACRQPFNSPFFQHYWQATVITLIAHQIDLLAFPMLISSTNALDIHKTYRQWNSRFVVVRTQQKSEEA